MAASDADRRGLRGHPAGLRTDPGTEHVPSGWDPRRLAAAQSQAPREVQPEAVQLALDLDDAPALTEASGLPEMSAGECRVLALAGRGPGEQSQGSRRNAPAAFSGSGGRHRASSAKPLPNHVKSRAISIAALCPGAPVTPPPGCVPAPQR